MNQGWCPVCRTVVDMLPSPTGNCANCYNHTLVLPPKLLFSEMRWSLKEQARARFHNAKMNDGYRYETIYDDQGELTIMSRRKE